MKRFIALVLIVFMAFAVFAAGGKEETVSSTPASNGNVVQNASQIDEFETVSLEVTEDNIIRGGKLVVGSIVEVSSYAPWRFRSEFYLLGCVYEPLLMFDNEGEVVPYLLESFEGDPETLTYTLKVRDGVNFSDGSEFTGEVLLWNLQNFKENSNTSATHFGSVDYFELVDEDTVVIHLKEWNSQIPYSLNNCAGMMYSKKAFDEHGYDWCLENPVGTGPYVLVEKVTDSYKKFVKNENYWNKDIEPLYDEIEARIYGNNMAAQAALLAGECDVFNGGDYGMKDMMSSMGYNLYQNKMWNRVYFLIFSSAIEGSPLADVRVRKAIAYAIDSETIVKSLDYNRTFVTNQYAVEGTGFYNPDVKGYGYDPQKAKELLAEAGYADGFKTKIITGLDQGLDRYMIALQQYLKDVNIDAELVYLDNAAWQSTSGIYGDGVTDGMILCGHGYGSNLVNQAVSNFSKRATEKGSVGMYHANKIHPDDLDAAIMTALTATDEATMYASMQEAERLLIDEYMIGYPVLTAYYDQIITQPNIVDKGFCNTYNRGNDYNYLYRIKL